MAPTLFKNDIYYNTIGIHHEGDVVINHLVYEIVEFSWIGIWKWEWLAGFRSPITNNLQTTNKCAECVDRNIGNNQNTKDTTHFFIYLFKTISRASPLKMVRFDMQTTTLSSNVCSWSEMSKENKLYTEDKITDWNHMQLPFSSSSCVRM